MRDSKTSLGSRHSRLQFPAIMYLDPSMKHSILVLLAASLAGQTLVVDRSIIGKPGGVRVERAQGFSGDSFQVGAAGETWMIDRIRLWGIPSDAPSCPLELGDSIEKLSLMGALDNPPV